MKQLHNIADNIDKKNTDEKSEKRCRNGVPKSTQTRKDKSDVKYTKPLPYTFTLAKRCWDG